MKTQQQGLTLLELVVVIVILGILAATAIPKHVTYTTEARIASLNGLAGAIRSAVTLVQSRYVATGNTAATTVTLADGTSVTTTAGNNGGVSVVAAGGIDVAVETGGTFVYVSSTGGFNLPTA